MSDIDQEAVKNLAEMFPGIHRNEISSFLEWNSFDEAVNLLIQIYPQNANNEEREYDNDENGYDDFIALSNSIPLDDQNEMIIDIQKDFPDFDDEICLVFLEDSKFNLEEAKKEAYATRQLFRHQEAVSKREEAFMKLKKNNPNLSDTFVLNALEAADGDYSTASALIRESIEPDKKSKKKQILFENGPVSHIATSKKPKKFKKKTIPSIKSTEKRSLYEFSQINEKMRYEAQITQLMDTFGKSSKDLTHDDYEEALKLTNGDIDRAASILSEKLKCIELNREVSNADNGSNPNSNSTHSVKMRELIEMFPFASTSDLEDLLYNSYGNIQIVSELMLNRMSDNPRPEEELLEELLKEIPHEENPDADDDDQVVRYYRKKPSSSASVIHVNKTNKMPDRPSMHGKTESITIDLHGMRVAEAQETVIRTLRNVQNSNTGIIYFITGRGQHSKGNVPVLRPLVMKMCKERGYRPAVSQNRGTVICNVI